MTTEGDFKNTLFTDDGKRLTPKQIKQIRSSIKEQSIDFAFIADPKDHKPMAIVTSSSITYPPFAVVSIEEGGMAILSTSGLYTVLLNPDTGEPAEVIHDATTTLKPTDISDISDVYH